MRVFLAIVTILTISFGVIAQSKTSRRSKRSHEVITIKEKHVIHLLEDTLKRPRLDNSLPNTLAVVHQIEDSVFYNNFESVMNASYIPQSYDQLVIVSRRKNDKMNSFVNNFNRMMEEAAYKVSPEEAMLKALRKSYEEIMPSIKDDHIIRKAYQSSEEQGTLDFKYRFIHKISSINTPLTLHIATRSFTTLPISKRKKSSPNLNAQELVTFSLVDSVFYENFDLVINSAYTTRPYHQLIAVSAKDSQQRSDFMTLFYREGLNNGGNYPLAFKQAVEHSKKHSQMNEFKVTFIEKQKTK